MRRCGAKNWPNAFDQGNTFFLTLKDLSALRGSQPALRYGRQYFRPGTPFALLYTNQATASQAPGAGAQRGGVTIYEVNGSVSHGPARVVPVHLAPIEVQFLSRIRM